MWTPGELDLMRADQAALMRDEVEIDRGTSAWSEDAQETVTTWEPVYRAPDGGAGPARVVIPHGAPIVSPSGEVITPRTALVTVPWGTPVAEGDRVRVVTGPSGVPEVVWVQAVEAAGVPTACRLACGAL